MSELDDIRRHLTELKGRLARGEVSRAEYEDLKRELLAGLSVEERASIEGAATPAPTPRKLGPSPVRTKVPRRESAEVEAGEVLFDQWRIVREIGRGGFATVYEAEDVKLGRSYAIKVLDPTMVARAELLGRFRREVSVMRELNHPNVARVFDYREDAEQGLAVISMELVVGCSVEDLIREARQANWSLERELVLAIVRQVLEALGAAHAKGIIHRDVSPKNVLVAGKTAKELLSEPSARLNVRLTDFGIAGLVDRTTKDGSALGTAAYVAPEVLRGEGATERADLYAVGALLYGLLTLQVPTGKLVPVKSTRPSEGWADRIVNRAMEQEPRDRYRTAMEFEWALEAGVREEEPEVPDEAVKGPEVREYEVPPIEVEVGRVEVKTKEIPGLPPMSDELVREMGEVEGLRRVIRELQVGIHPSLGAGRRSVEQAREQYEGLMRDVEGYVDGLDARRLAEIGKEFAGDSRDSGQGKASGEMDQRESTTLRLRNLFRAIVERFAQTPDASFAGEMRQRPKAIDEGEFTTMLLRCRLSGRGLRALRETESAYKRAVDREVARLGRELEPKEERLRELREADLARVLDAVFSETGSEREFPNEVFHGVAQQLMRSRGYEWGWTELWERAEKGWRAWRAERERRAAYADALAAGRAALGRGDLNGAARSAELALSKDPGSREAMDLARTVARRQQIRRIRARGAAVAAACAGLFGVVLLTFQWAWEHAGWWGVICGVAVGIVLLMMRFVPRRWRWANVAGALLVIATGLGPFVGRGPLEAPIIREREEREAQARRDPEEGEEAQPAVPPFPRIRLETENLQFELDRGASATKTVTITNAGGGDLEVGPPRPLATWLTAGVGTMSDGGIPLTVGVDATGKGAGGYTSTSAVLIPSNDPGRREVALQVTMKVRASPGPMLGEERVASLPGGVRLAMVWIPPGAFTMGSPRSASRQANDGPQHQVTISKGFWMGATEVTQEQHRAAMGTDPSKFKGSNRPMEQVSWYDAVEFCNWLSSREGLTPCYSGSGSSIAWNWSANGYRLPTEAEWEYACRAGTSTDYHAGDGSSALDRAGWYDANSGGAAHNVAQKSPNGWGLYDMHGNVWEWCWDWVGKSALSGIVVDPVGPASGSFKAARGGSYANHAQNCRAFSRSTDNTAQYRAQGYGFRVSRNAG